MIQHFPRLQNTYDKGPVFSLTVSAKESSSPPADGVYSASQSVRTASRAPLITQLLMLHSNRTT